MQSSITDGRVEKKGGDNPPPFNPDGPFSSVRIELVLCVYCMLLAVQCLRPGSPVPFLFRCTRCLPITWPFRTDEEEERRGDPPLLCTSLARCPILDLLVGRLSRRWE